MAWTDKQQRTIELRGKNILVSAAAGSGKTAVLIERIKQLILDPENPVDVDRFLITTFTKAAAAEMKGRLEKAIRKAMSEEGANKEHLRRQLRLLPRANISTFHSFTIEILKKYFYLIDLEPGFKTADENQMVIFKRESIDELFDKRFSEDYDAFTAWLNKYSTYKSEEAIKGSILAVYNEMRSIPHYMKWAEDTAANYHSDSPIKAFGIDKFIEEEVEKDLNEAYRLYQKAADTLREEDLVRMADIIEGNLEQLKKIPRYYEESGVFPRVPDLNLTSVSAKKDEKDTYAMVKDTVQQYQNEAKKIINSISENYFAIPWEEYDKDMRAQADDIDYLIGLIKEFEEIFNAKKATVMAVEFDDMMHYAIDILEDETVQKEYREKYEYIFVDEYQDSNQLQETIVGLIARDNNLFMVGDVKQSIYKFRQAEPKLFMDRYAKYASDDEVLSENIDLNTNFRSKPEVIDTVNAIFGEVMKGYDDNAALHYPATFEKYEGGTTALRVVNNASYSDSDELGEAEFKAIADEIKAHLGTEVYDVPAQKTRKISYRDITVLTRGNPMMASLERYLNNEGIPAFGNSSDGYFETVELQVFLNMLRVINNTRQDIPLISVMRSVAFGFTARQMAQIRIQYKEGSFYSAAKNYAEAGDDEVLRQKVADMFATIDYWKKLKLSVSLEELIRTLLEETGYYDYCSGLPVGKQRASNLRLLLEKAADFERTNYTGLHGFLAYVDAMIERDVKVGEAKAIGESEDVVRLMTIHGSKGLEFPIVILAGMGKKMTGNNSKGSIDFHKDYALAIPFVNKEEAWHRKTLLQRAIVACKREESIDEEIRILYVALTRAKDKLILMGSCRDIEKLSTDVPKMSSYLNVVFPLISDKCDFKIIESQGDYDGDVERVDGNDPLELIEIARSGRDEDAIAEIDKRLSYVYPYDDNNVRSKYSVSQLNHLEIDRQPVMLNKSLFSEKKRELTAAEIGTAMHAVMERMDFARGLAEGIDYIREKADEMLTAGQLTAEERAALNEENIAAFFKTDIGRRAATAADLHKEREFILLTDVEGTEAIVQGIIDCYFVEDDGIVLIDYKNSYMGGDTTEEVIRQRYEKQILLYKEALEGATGLPVKQSYLYLFNLQNFTQIT